MHNQRDPGHLCLGASGPRLAAQCSGSFAQASVVNLAVVSSVMPAVLAETTSVKTLKGRKSSGRIYKYLHRRTDDVSFRIVDRNDATHGKPSIAGRLPIPGKAGASDGRLLGFLFF